MLWIYPEVKVEIPDQLEVIDEVKKVDGERIVTTKFITPADPQWPEVVERYRNLEQRRLSKTGAIWVKVDACKHEWGEEVPAAKPLLSIGHVGIAMRNGGTMWRKKTKRKRRNDLH